MWNQVRIQNAQNDCPELKYFVAPENEFSLELLSSRDSMFLLKMKKNIFFENPNWFDSEMFSDELLINFDSNVSFGEDKVNSKKNLIFICPFWKNKDSKTFKFEVSYENKSSFELSVGRLLEPSPPENSTSRRF